MDSTSQDSASIWDSRGWYYFKTGDTTSALSDLNKALEIAPDRDTAYESYCHRAQVYYTMKEYDKAIADLNKSIELNDEYGEAYFHRGLCYKSLNQNDQAKADFEAAISNSTDQSIINKATDELNSIQ
jgi:tetratricopeptide (TPR) repeat protein